MWGNTQVHIYIFFKHLPVTKNFLVPKNFSVYVTIALNFPGSHWPSLVSSGFRPSIQLLCSRSFGSGGLHQSTVQNECTQGIRDILDLVKRVTAPLETVTADCHAAKAKPYQALRPNIAFLTKERTATQDEPCRLCNYMLPRVPVKIEPRPCVREATIINTF